MNELFVTFNVITILTAAIGGGILGYFVVTDTVRTILKTFMVNGRIDQILKLVPLLIIVLGTGIVTAFYISAIITDVMSDSENDILRSAGRGICNFVFVLSVGIGDWLAVRRIGEHHDS